MSTPTPTRASGSAAVERAVADRLAAAIRAVPGVADLHGGRFGEVALLYPRHRVTGLRRTPQGMEVHLVLDLSARRPLSDIADEVRGVVTPEIAGRVDIHVDDAREATS